MKNNKIWYLLWLLTLIVILYVYQPFEISGQKSVDLETKIFPQITPHKCIKSAILYGDVQTTICVRPPSADIWLTSNILDRGAFEGWKVSVILRQMSLYPGAVFLDIGANIGMYTLMVAAAGREVVAVDAVLENLAFVHHSLVLSNNQHRVRIVNRPVSDKLEALFPVNDDNNNPGGARLLPEYAIQDKSKITGPGEQTTTLLELLRFTNSKTVIIKLDVEGSECKVLHQYLVSPDSSYFLPYITLEWRHIQRNLDSKCPDLAGLIDSFYQHNYRPYGLPYDDEPFSERDKIIHEMDRDTVHTTDQDLLWAHQDSKPITV